MADIFKLDKTQFSAMSFEQADRSMTDFTKHSTQERLCIANKLIAIAYNFPVDSPPAMDKFFFAARKMENG